MSYEVRSKLNANEMLESLTEVLWRSKRVHVKATNLMSKLKLKKIQGDTSGGHTKGIAPPTHCNLLL